MTLQKQSEAPLLGWHSPCFVCIITAGLPPQDMVVFTLQMHLAFLQLLDPGCCLMNLYDVRPTTIDVCTFPTLGLNYDVFVQSIQLCPGGERHRQSNEDTRWAESIKC